MLAVNARTVTLMVAMCAAPTLEAVETPLTPRAVDEAVRLGQTTVERHRTAFHGSYRLPVDRPPVDHIEVITPFRRAVLVAEQLARTGTRAFSQRQALERPDIGIEEIELRVELTFHPLNTYVGVPAYAVTLRGPDGIRIEPRTFGTTSRYTPRVEGPPVVLPVPGGFAMPGNSQPVLGGTVSARFDLRPLNPAAVYEATISEGGQDLAMARLDLAGLR